MIEYKTVKRKKEAEAIIEQGDYLLNKFYEVVNNSQKKYWSIEDFGVFCRRKANNKVPGFRELTNIDKAILENRIGRDFLKLRKWYINDNITGELKTVYCI